VSGWDTGSIENFSRFIGNCPSLTTLDISHFDTSSVIYFSRFAYGCTSLTTLDVSGWNTSNAVDFSQFISNCPSLTTLDVSSWNTSNAVNFSRFAYGCTSLTELDVSAWNTSSLGNGEWFAYGCTSLTTLDVSGWNTSSLGNVRGFVQNCTSLTTLDVSGWNTGSITQAGAFVAGCAGLTELDVSAWDTSSLQFCNFFMAYCANITSLDVSGWNTSAVTNFSYFAVDSGLQDLTIYGGSGNPFADSPCTNYAHAFSGTNLSQQSIDNILVSIEAAGTYDGTFDQSGGSPPSVIGEAAIDSLVARGWTITVTGGYEPAQEIPLELSVKAWYDVSDVSTLTKVGDGVAAMGDLSGNGFTLTSDDPIYYPYHGDGSYKLNGIPVLMYGNPDHLYTNAFSIPQTGSFFVVFSPNSYLGHFFIQSKPGVDVFKLGSANNFFYFTREGSTDPLTPEIALDPAPNIGVGITDPATVYPFINGTPLDPVADSLAAGDHGFALRPRGGIIAEVLVFDYMLSEADRQRVEGYLAHKWGLESLLPASHPYKTVAP
jgi:surface protein